MTNIAELTRALVDIESITNNEEAVGTFLLDHLSRLAARTSGHAERCEVEAHRFNVLAHWGDPVVTLSTHMDTVPPFFPSREDDEFVWGRGSADAKGIIASMIGAAEGLLEAGVRNFALAVCRRRGAQQRRGLRGGAESARLALPDQRRAHGKQAGAGEQGHAALRSRSAREAGPFGLSRAGRVGDREAAGCAASRCGRFAFRKMRCSVRARSTSASISGGRAPNVIADAAMAEIAIRLVGDPEPVRRAMSEAVDGPGRSAGNPVHPGDTIRGAGRIRDVRRRVHNGCAGVCE